MIRHGFRVALQAVEYDDDGESVDVRVLDTLDTIDITADPGRSGQVWARVQQAVDAAGQPQSRRIMVTDPAAIAALRDLRARLDADLKEAQS